MRRRIFAAAGAAAVLLAGGFGLAQFNRSARAQGSATPVSATAPASDPALVARGQYLATAADCVACHTTVGGKRYAGGLAFKLPFGTLYSTNITPDRETGIGTWSDDDFVNALHKGVGKGGKHLYPAFPYTSYAKIPRGDALAIKAYLFSLPAVHAPARKNDMAFPFNQRWGMIFWNALFARNQVFQPDASKSVQWNRGAYLVTGLGHCGECHTPRNFAYGLKGGQALAGEVVQGWRAYNITSDRANGIGNWRDEDLAAYLSTGHAPGHGSASGSMAEAVENSLQHLSPQDISAMVVYLKSTAPKRGKGEMTPNPSPPASRSGPYAPVEVQQNQLGFQIFQSACASCHAYNGQGPQNEYAALYGSQAVNDVEGMNMTQVILHGAHMRTKGGEAYMPAFGQAYRDAEIAAVSNWTIRHFGGKDARITPADVAKRRKMQ